MRCAAHSALGSAHHGTILLSISYCPSRVLPDQTLQYRYRYSCITYQTESETPIEVSLAGASRHIVRPAACLMPGMVLINPWSAAAIATVHGDRNLGAAGLHRRWRCCGLREGSGSRSRPPSARRVRRVGVTPGESDRPCLGPRSRRPWQFPAAASLQEAGQKRCR